jgi:alpha-N-arabinofuranosidase
MKTTRLQLAFAITLLALLGAVCFIPLRAPLANTQANTITVEVNKPGAAIAPTMYGLFFEDINFGADGGLYPERIKNNSFEFPDPMMGWKRVTRADAKGTLQLYDAGSRTNQPNAHYLQIKADTGSGGFGISNEGFRGIGVEQGAEYSFSVRARKVGDTSVGCASRLKTLTTRSSARPPSQA